MKNLLILLVFSAVSFQAICVNMPIKAAQALIDQLKGIESGFCGKSFFTRGIRGEAGKHCKTLLGAALAAEVCIEKNTDEFINSQCHKELANVHTQTNIRTTLGDTVITRSWAEIGNPEKDWKKSIAFVISEHGAEKVCSFINSISLFIGFSESDCVRNIND